MPVLAYKLTGKTECVLIGVKHLIFSQVQTPDALLQYLTKNKTLFIESSFNDGVNSSYYLTSFKNSDQYLKVTSDLELQNLRSELIQKRKINNMAVDYKNEPLLDQVPTLMYAQFIITLGRALWSIEKKLEGFKAIDFKLFEYAFKNKYRIKTLENTDANFLLIDRDLRLIENYVGYFKDIYKYAASDDAFNDELELENVLKKQNIVEVENQINRTYFNFKFLNWETSVIVKERNRNWLPKLVTHLKNTDQKCTIAVGAAHLVGTGGLLNLLADAGIKVEPMSNTFSDLQN